MHDRELTLEWLPGHYAVCRLNSQSEGAEWLARALHTPPSMAGGRLLSITRTECETAIVIDETLLPAEVDAAMPVQRGFVALRIAGTLDFGLVGILAKITGALAAADVSVFVLSTYDTDIILARERDQQRATHALSGLARFM